MAGKVFRDERPTGGVVLQRDRYRIGLKDHKTERGAAGVIVGAILLVLLVFGVPTALHFFWRI